MVKALATSSDNPELENIIGEYDYIVCNQVGEGAFLPMPFGNEEMDKMRVMLADEYPDYLDAYLEARAAADRGEVGEFVLIDTYTIITKSMKQLQEYLEIFKSAN